jgi:hypothetical protein
LATFTLHGEKVERRLRAVQHVRPGDADASQRAAALAAFEDVVGPCVDAAEDRAVQVGADDGWWGPQYCLVTLERTDQRIVGAAAFIVRCLDEVDAASVLTRARRLIDRAGHERNAAAEPAA